MFRLFGSFRPYFFLLPAGMILFVFHLFPLAMVVWISLFRDWRTADSAYVGLENYQRIFESGEFVRSLGISVWYALGTIPATIALALVFAVLLGRKKRLAGVYRVAYFLPFITSTVAAAAVWKWILHVDQKGLANSLLAAFGVGPVRFTESSTGIFELAFGGELPIIGGGPSLALISVMLFAVWHTFGFYVIILTAGMGQIPKETYEAAWLDGAGPVRSFFSITLPLLRPVIGFLVVISTIAAFQTFNQIYIMAPAERLNSARNATMYIFTEFWNYQRFGTGAAASVALFGVLLVLTALQLRVSRRKD